jgi:hypothetical protein
MKTTTTRKNKITAKQRLIAILISFSLVVIVGGLLLYTVAIGFQLFDLSNSNVEANSLRSVPAGAVAANNIYEQNEQLRESIYNSSCWYKSFIGNSSNLVRFILVAIYLLIIGISCRIINVQYTWMKKRMSN